MNSSTDYGRVSWQGSRQDPHPERRGARRLVTPFRCRVWTQHSRPEDQLTESACKSLRESIEKNGQHQPALGRPVSDDPECDVEIICGARRHSVSRSLGRDLLVELRDMTDAEAYIAMYEENLLREGDSPYVRAQILLRALRSRTYSTQEELGSAFNLSHSAVSRLLMLAQLPSVVVAAFHSPNDICEGWGVELYRLWADEAARLPLITRARDIAKSEKRQLPRQIYEALITQSRVTRKGRPYRDIPIKGSSGVILYHEQERLDTVVYIISKKALTPTRHELLRQSLVRALEADAAHDSTSPDAGSAKLDTQDQAQPASLV